MLRNYFIILTALYSSANTAEIPNPFGATTSSTASSYSMELKSGWNFISAPFNGEMDIATIVNAGCSVNVYSNDIAWFSSKSKGTTSVAQAVVAKCAYSSTINFSPTINSDSFSMETEISSVGKGAIPSSSAAYSLGTKYAVIGTPVETTIGSVISAGASNVLYYDGSSWNTGSKASSTVALPAGSSFYIQTADTISSSSTVTDDHGDTTRSATSVSPNSTTSGYLGQSDDHDYFKIVLLEYGSLTIKSTGSTDTYGFLYNSSGASLEIDNSSGVDDNFRISKLLDAGTYYAKVKPYYSTSIGSYYFVSKFEKADKDDHGNSISSATAINYNSTTVANIETQGDYDYFKIVLPSSGTLTLSSSGANSVDGDIFDKDGKSVYTNRYNTAVNFDDHFSITQSLDSGTYYVKVMADYSFKTGTYSLVSKFVSSVASSSSSSSSAATIIGDYNRTSSIVRDSNKSLMWQDDSEAKSRYSNWNGATAYCTELILDEYINWRLPTIEELKSIVDTNNSPAIHSIFQNIYSGRYWSSTLNETNANNIWYVNFSTGNSFDIGDKTNSYDTKYVRCVRTIVEGQ